MRRLYLVTLLTLALVLSRPYLAFGGMAQPGSFGLTRNASLINQGTLPAARLPNGLNNVTVTGPTTGRSYALPDSDTTIATILSKLSAFAATTSAEFAGVISDETGTGKVVLDTNATLVTPILGTPQSVTLTNGTGLPIGTGVSGLAAGIATFLGTPSSANLAAAITNETGSGLAVFATSPTLTTPVLGAATATSLNMTSSTANSLLIGDSTVRTIGPSIISPVAEFSSTTGPSRGIGVLHWVNSNVGSQILLGKSRGATAGTFTTLASNDALGTINFAGANNATSTFDFGAQILVVASEAWVDSTNNGTRLKICTVATGGSTTCTFNFRLTTTGLNLGSDADATNPLSVVGAANITGALTIGSSTNNLSVFASTTSAQLKTLISDETGSGGSVVFATSPTLTTPVLGAATGTSLGLSGAISAANGIFGTTPATTGIVRIPNADSIYARNGANSADMALIGTSYPTSINVLTLGQDTTLGKLGFTRSGSIADGSNFNLTNVFGTNVGILFISMGDGTHAAMFFLKGTTNATAELQDVDTVFSVTKDTAGSSNIYWDAGTTSYTIQNKTGSAAEYHCTFIGF